MESCRVINDSYANQRWEELYTMMPEKVHAILPLEEFAAQCESTVNFYGIPTQTQILEIQTADFELNTETEDPGDVIPLTANSNYLPNPVELDSAFPGPTAIALGISTNEQTGIKCWVTFVLQPEDDAWALISFYFVACEAKGHDGAWYLQQSAEMEAKGMHRAAFLYRHFGDMLSIPSPYIYTPAIVKDLQATETEVAPPNLPLYGIRPAETWTTESGKKFLVNYVAIMGAPDHLSLDLRYQTELEDTESPEAEAERNELYDYVCQTFPEYMEAFDGVFIGTENAAGDGYRMGYRFPKSE